MTKRQILRSIGFLTLLGLLVAGFSWLLYPKDNNSIGRKGDWNANGLLAEAEHSVDVLFMGDSLALYGTIAPQLWKDYGIPAYTYATPLQNMVKSRRMLLTALKRQSPKVIFLEVHGLYQQIRPQEEMADRLYTWIPLLRHHDNWKRVPPREFFRPIRYTSVRENKGYYLTMLHNPPKQADYMNREDPECMPQADAVRLLGSIRDICRKQGVELILYSVPNAHVWNRARHDAVSQVSESLELPYLDLNLEDVGIDWSTDCMDGGDHLNYLVASKVTAWLGKWLSRNTALTDKRGAESYALWDQQVECFLRQAEQTARKGLIPQ